MNMKTIDAALAQLAVRHPGLVRPTNVEPMTLDAAAAAIERRLGVPVRWTVQS